MAHLEGNVLKLNEEELNDFLAAIIQTEEIDHGENLGDVHDEWLSRFARQAFEAAGREFTWEFELEETAAKSISNTIEEHF